MNKNTAEQPIFLSKKNLMMALLVPLSLLVVVVLYLFFQNALSRAGYVDIQKDYFLLINQFLGQFPTLQTNLTQLGDTFVLFCLISPFFIKKPILWENFIWASLVSLVFSKSLKLYFSIPRPAQVFGEDNIIIVGKVLKGFSSLPSGHSISVFSAATVLFFVLILNKKRGCLFAFLLYLLSLAAVLSRIGVGAHFPLDVFIGSIFGIISGIIGLWLNQKFPIWRWIANPRFSIYFLITFVICFILLCVKFYQNPLLVFAIAALILGISMYQMFTIHVKKNH